MLGHYNAELLRRGELVLPRKNIHSVADSIRRHHDRVVAREERGTHVEPLNKRLHTQRKNVLHAALLTDHFDETHTAFAVAVRSKRNVRVGHGGARRALERRC
eukprot:Amastigsp_a176088_33.p4 type:complete len:103 gc:universal Amastigsp_a176088_33:622-930(+)